MLQFNEAIYGKPEIDAVQRVLKSRWLSGHKETALFEDELARWWGRKYCVSTNSGSSANFIATQALQLPEGSEVITAAGGAFPTTINPMIYLHLKPVFVDIDEKTFNINPDLIEAAITPKTKAILPVHLFGFPAEMGKIIEIATKYNLKIIEDACQAHGAEISGKKVGSFATSCFSFYPTKNMTTGEGGMITTNDAKVAEKSRKLISHGSSKKYYHDFLGYNYRLTDLAAAIGLAQLKKLPEFNEKRKKNAQFLYNSLKNIPGIVLPQILSGHVFHQFTIRITPELKKSREEVISHLIKKGVGNSVFYPLPIHKQKAYKKYNSQNFAVAEKMAEEVLSLPIHPGLREEDLSQIIKAFEELL